MCKKRKKKKKEKNPGKIQLARDPTASDDACPRPILGWPVYLPQPLAGARITEKRRRRPNHVTRFPLRALSLCLSVALSCIIYYSAAAATMYTSPSLRHVQVGSPPKFLPYNPPPPPKTASNMRRASIDGIFPALLLIFPFASLSFHYG